MNECDILATVHVHAVINAINAIRMAGCVVLYLAVRNANESRPVYFVVKRTTAACQPAGISPEFDAIAVSIPDIVIFGLVTNAVGNVLACGCFYRTASNITYG